MVRKCLAKIRRQEGQLLVIALVLLVLISTIAVSLLALAASALKQGTVVENATVRLYAAGAGVESAWQNINIGNPNIPVTIGDEYPYSIGNVANGLPVSVSIKLIDVVEPSNPVAKTYLVHSVYTGSGGKATTIDAKIVTAYGDYNYYLDNAMTVGGDLYCTNKVSVNGTVQAGNISFKVPDFGVNPDPPPVWGDTGIPPTVFPSANYLRDYFNNISHNTHPGGWSITTDLTLTTTEYVVGDCTINNNHLNLNGQTLFVDGDIYITDPIVMGLGAIVATGNISFKPNSDTGDATHGVLLFALENIAFWPSGTFWGWIATADGLDVKSGVNPNYNWEVADPTGINFPGIGGIGGPGVPVGKTTIQTWKVTTN